MSNEHDTDRENDAPIRHKPATDVTTSQAKSNARLAAETRRAGLNQGKELDDPEKRGRTRNEPDQRVHQASQEHVIHDENTDRGADDLYRTEGDNEVSEWRRHSSLDAPPARPGYVQRFIRVRLGTTRDAANWQKKFREGWRPVKVSDVTDRSLPTTFHEGAQVIGVEDLLLCEMPERVFMQRQKYFQTKLDNQNAAIERQLREASMPAETGGFGPIEQDRRTSVSVRAFTPGKSRSGARVAGDED